MDDLSDDQVTAILLYHVLPFVISSPAIPEGTTMVATAEGTEIMVTKNSTADTVVVNDAEVIIADILASNG